MEQEQQRAHLYCRVSSAGQEDGHSLDTQEASCRAYADDRGFIVTSAVREVWSGGHRHRPQLDALLDQLLPGDMVIAYALDRLSRSQVDTAILIDRIESAGATLCLVTEDFERSATGTFLRNARAFVAELEREKIAERTQRGRRARVASGKPFVSGVAPFGYQWNADKSGYRLDPETAPIVRDIFDLAVVGVSLRGIAMRLTERGISSPAGKGHWTPMSVRRILTRPIYSGDHVAYRDQYDRQPNGGYTRRPRPIEERIVLPGIAPPIITRSEQEAVKARLASNQGHSKRNNRNPEASLLRTGFARCGYCGWSLGVNNHATSRTARGAQYRCYSRIRECPHPTIAASVVDDAVWERISEVLRDPAIIAAEVTRHREDGGLESDLVTLELRLTSITSKQERIARAIATVDDDNAAEPLLNELKALAEAKAAAERERNELKRRITDQAAESERVKSLADWCERVSANLDSLKYDEKRLAIDALGVQVRVWKEGAADSRGERLPRWELTLNPASSDGGFVYPSTSSGRTPPG